MLIFVARASQRSATGSSLALTSAGKIDGQQEAESSLSPM
jgi:hypothetical protein